jgi:hypothetical protein
MSPFALRVRTLNAAALGNESAGLSVSCLNRPIYPACRSAWIRSSRVVTWFQLATLGPPAFACLAPDVSFVRAKQINSLPARDARRLRPCLTHYGCCRTTSWSPRLAPTRTIHPGAALKVHPSPVTVTSSRRTGADTRHEPPSLATRTPLSAFECAPVS